MHTRRSGPVFLRAPGFLGGSSWVASQVRAIAPSTMDPTRDLGKTSAEHNIGDGRLLEGLGIKGQRNLRNCRLLTVSRLSKPSEDGD